MHFCSPELCPGATCRHLPTKGQVAPGTAGSPQPFTEQVGTGGQAAGECLLCAISRTAPCHQTALRASPHLSTAPNPLLPEPSPALLDSGLSSRHPQGIFPKLSMTKSPQIPPQPFVALRQPIIKTILRASLSWPQSPPSGTLSATSLVTPKSTSRPLPEHTIRLCSWP